MFSGSARDRHRLSRTDLGSRHVSLPDAAATGCVTEVTCSSSAFEVAVFGIFRVATNRCGRAGSPLHAVTGKPRRAQEWRALPKAPSIRNGRRFVATVQNCVMQIGRMRFARVERNDHALVREVDFYILHAGDVRQHRSQFAHTFIAIFTFRGDLDRFQNSLVGAFRKKWIGWIGISRSCRVHRVFWLSLYLTCQAPAVVASVPVVMLSETLQRNAKHEARLSNTLWLSARLR